MPQSYKIQVPFAEQSRIPVLDLQSEPLVRILPDKRNGAQEQSDAQWLRENRHQFEMTQSNIVSYLEITTGQNVNPGRVAEIETGQRCIPTHWREKLEYLFHRLQQTRAKGLTWRELI